MSALAAYAVDFRRSLRKADPALPILLVVCAEAAGTFVVLAGGAATALTLVAIGLLATILASSIGVAEPTTVSSGGARVSSRPTQCACAGSGDGSTSSGPPWRLLHSYFSSPPCPTRGRT